MIRVQLNSLNAAKINWSDFWECLGFGSFDFIKNQMGVQRDFFDFGVALPNGLRMGGVTFP